MAEAVGRDDDAQLYLARYEAIKAAYGAAFVGADGTVRGDSQTAYILTITNDLHPGGTRGRRSRRSSSRRSNGATTTSRPASSASTACCPR